MHALRGTRIERTLADIQPTNASRAPTQNITCTPHTRTSTCCACSREMLRVSELDGYVPRWSCAQTGHHSLDGTSTHFYDSWAYANSRDSGYTWHRSNPYTRVWLEPDARLDYIFVQEPDTHGRGAVERCEVVCTTPDAEGCHPSDHFGVLAYLRTDTTTPLARHRRKFLAYL